MDKRNYVRPQLKCEAFHPDNYIAACYFIACNLGLQGGTTAKYCETHNKVETNPGEDCIAHGIEGNSGCGVATNQYIRTDANGQPLGQMFELNSLAEGGGDIPIQNVTVNGNNITWQSVASDGRTWNHEGTYSTTNSHGNHS